MEKGTTTPDDDSRFRELSHTLKALTAALGLPTCDGLTGWRGFLPGDPSRLVCDSWQEAANGW